MDKRQFFVHGGAAVRLARVFLALAVLITCQPARQARAAAPGPPLVTGFTYAQDAATPTTVHCTVTFDEQMESTFTGPGQEDAPVVLTSLSGGATLSLKADKLANWDDDFRQLTFSVAGLSPGDAYGVTLRHFLSGMLVSMPTNTDYTVYLPQVAGLAASPASLAAGGGAVTATLSGGGLPPDYTLGAFAPGAAAPAVTATAVDGSHTARTAALSLPANTTDTDIVYTLRASADGGATWMTGAGLEPAVTVARQALPDMKLTSLTAQPGSVAYQGGPVAVTLTGQYLQAPLSVGAFAPGAAAPAATAPLAIAAGGATATGPLTLPANTGDADTACSLKVSTDDGATWRDAPTAAVTVRKKVTEIRQISRVSKLLTAKSVRGRDNTLRVQVGGVHLPDTTVLGVFDNTAKGALIKTGSFTFSKRRLSGVAHLEMPVDTNRAVAYVLKVSLDGGMTWESGFVKRVTVPRVMPRIESITLSRSSVPASASGTISVSVKGKFLPKNTCVGLFSDNASATKPLGTFWYASNLDSSTKGSFWIPELEIQDDTAFHIRVSLSPDGVCKYWSTASATLIRTGNKVYHPGTGKSEADPGGEGGKTARTNAETEMMKTAQPPAGVTVTGLELSTTELPAQGGILDIGLSGENLPDGVLVGIRRPGDEKSPILLTFDLVTAADRGTAVGSAYIPGNYNTAAVKYPIVISLDGGKNWLDDPTASVTVAAGTAPAPGISTGTPATGGQGGEVEVTDCVFPDGTAQMIIAAFEADSIPDVIIHYPVDYPKFAGKVEWNGATLDPAANQYWAAEGSTIIRLNAAFLRTQPPGDYRVRT